MGGAHSGGGHGSGHGKGPKTIDDFLAAEGGKHAHDLGEAFGHFDAFTHQDNVDKLLIETLQPAHDSFYTALQTELSHIGGTTTSVHNKRKDLEKAVTVALKQYFKAAMPSALGALKGVDEDEHYEILSRLYDQHTGADRNQRIGSIQVLVEQARSKQAKVADVLNAARQYRGQHPEAAYNMLKQRVIQHHFSRFHPHQVGGYLKGRLADYNLDVSEPTRFSTLDLDAYTRLYEGLKTGRGLGEGGYETFGLERKTAKKASGGGGHGH